MKHKNRNPEVVTGSVDSNGIPWTAPMSKEHPEPAWMREHKADVAPAQTGKPQHYCKQCGRIYNAAIGENGRCPDCAEKYASLAQNRQHTSEKQNVIWQDYLQTVADLDRSDALNAELLEALKELLASEESPHTETVRYLAREQARAAIAKAEGREE